MKYVIVGVGVAGIEAAKEIRKKDADGDILMISADAQIHSRCMLHKFIAGERDEKGLDFTELDFFEKYRIHWKRCQDEEGLPGGERDYSGRRRACKL